MKKLLSIAAASLAVAAFADGVPAANYSPTIGVTKITTSSKDTIVPVAFKSLRDGGNIAVSDLVYPKSLVDGTELYVYDGDKYSAWVLASGAWVGASTATKTAFTPAVGSSDAKLVAGSGIWIVRPGSDEAATRDIYVYGAYQTGQTSTTIAGKTTLVANPLQTAATVSISGLAVGDSILVPKGDEADADRYLCTDATTPVWKKSRRTVTLPKFEVGQGFWYVPSGNTVATITWTAAPDVDPGE